MVTEDQVVEAVCVDLQAHGWRIESTAMTTERGADIVASRNGRKLIVEAKGGTSARGTSQRFGKPFNASQVHSHVGRALVEALVAVTAGNQAAIALPDDRLHRVLIGKMQVGLRNATVHVLWVAADARTVSGTADLSDLGPVPAVG